MLEQYLSSLERVPRSGPISRRFRGALTLSNDLARPEIVVAGLNPRVHLRSWCVRSIHNS